MNTEIMEILEELKPGEVFTGDALVEDGVLDSFDIISLVSVLEEKYGIEIDGLDIVPENFQSIGAVVSLVEKSKKA